MQGEESMDGWMSITIQPRELWRLSIAESSQVFHYILRNGKTQYGLKEVNQTKGVDQGKNLNPTNLDAMEQIHFQTQTATKRQDKLLSLNCFIQAMGLFAVAGMTIPLVAGVAGRRDRSSQQPQPKPSSH